MFEPLVWVAIAILAAAIGFGVAYFLLQGRAGARPETDAQAQSRLAEVESTVKERLLEAKELGADGFLSKPFDLDVLTALIRSFLR